MQNIWNIIYFTIIRYTIFNPLNVKPDSIITLYRHCKKNSLNITKNLFIGNLLDKQKDEEYAKRPRLRV